MNKIKKIFDYYVKTSKMATTYIGVIGIYITGILAGKILYTLSKKIPQNHWSNYQSGSSPKKMY
jgi:hypothetical protein